MIKKYNNLSFMFFIPGIIVQTIGFVMSENYQTNEPLGILSVILLIGGTLSTATGFGFYAKAKGRNMLWGSVGFIGLLGLLILSLLKDRSGDSWNS
jgi:hypothetical protein